jgi:hypothetical protein
MAAPGSHASGHIELGRGCCPTAHLVSHASSNCSVWQCTGARCAHSPMPRVADVALLNLLLPSSSVQVPMSDLTVMCGQMCTPFHAYGASGWAARGNFGMGGRENPAVKDDGALFPPPGSNRPGAVSLVKPLGFFFPFGTVRHHPRNEPQQSKSRLTSPSSKIRSEISYHRITREREVRRTVLLFPTHPQHDNRRLEPKRLGTAKDRVQGQQGPCVARM